MKIIHNFEIKKISGNFNIEYDSELYDNIVKYGILEFIYLAELPDKSYNVINGKKRITVLKKLGKKICPCVIFKMSNKRYEETLKVI